MATLRNVSSPYRTSGSDIDLELWLSATLFEIVVAVLDTLGVGGYKRSKTYRLSCGKVELFLIDASAPDEVTLALQHNLRTMRGWDAVVAAQYLAQKSLIAHLTGTDRKHAKAQLAVAFGLNPIVYG
ncbi:MAG: hypothetical protein M0R06_12255 [Sphaerochaeta sp.]|jgi:hypothetical protein|nr:hypothetical protein [Sphaerochaeta sp.]